MIDGKFDKVDEILDNHEGMHWCGNFACSGQISWEKAKNKLYEAMMGVIGEAENANEDGYDERIAERNTLRTEQKAKLDKLFGRIGAA